RVLLEWLAGAFELVISPKLMAELERVLGYPKIREHITSDEATSLLGLLNRLARSAGDPTGPGTTRSSDPGDDYLIALAEAESAVLVTGDEHLLKLANDLPIYLPRKFLKLIQSED
ncbi:MAG: PIN domain-containing protein, partial [Actinomycetota bacterium]